MRTIAQLREQYGAELRSPDEARAAGILVPESVAAGLRLVVAFLCSPEVKGMLDQWAAEHGGVWCVDESWPPEAQRAALQEAVRLLRPLVEDYVDLVKARQALGASVVIEGPYGESRWHRLTCARARLTGPTVEAVIDRAKEKPTLTRAELPGLELILLQALRGLLRGE